MSLRHSAPCASEQSRRHSPECAFFGTIRHARQLLAAWGSAFRASNASRLNRRQDSPAIPRRRASAWLFSLAALSLRASPVGAILRMPQPSCQRRCRDGPLRGVRLNAERSPTSPRHGAPCRRSSLASFFPCAVLFPRRSAGRPAKRRRRNYCCCRQSLKLIFKYIPQHKNRALPVVGAPHNDAQQTLNIDAGSFPSGPLSRTIDATARPRLPDYFRCTPVRLSAAEASDPCSGRVGAPRRSGVRPARQASFQSLMRTSTLAAPLYMSMPGL